MPASNLRDLVVRVGSTVARVRNQVLDALITNFQTSRFFYTGRISEINYFRAFFGQLLCSK